MILFIEVPKDATRKPLELINEFCKVSRYKINTQILTAFLYINNKRSEIEIGETVPFTTASKKKKNKKTKILEINLPKETKTCTIKSIRC